MNPITIILVIFSALIHSIWNLLSKKSRNKTVFNWYIQLFGPIIFLPFFLYFLFTEKIPPIGWLYITLSGFCIMFYFYFLGRTYHHGNLSLTYPIVRSSIIFVPFLAFLWIQEKISLNEILGIIITLIGIYLLHLKSFKLKSILKPFRHLKEKATFFALITALFSSGYQVNDKVGVQFVHPFLYICLVWVISSILYFPVNFTKENRKDIKTEWRINKKPILISAFFNLFSYVLILFALTIDKVGSIVALRQIGVVFGVMLGGFSLKEKYIRIRLVASIIILVGFFLVAYS